MRTLSIVVSLVFSGLVSAQTPKEIVEKAIQAHGGSESLAKTKAMIQQATGQIYYQAMEVAAVREGKWALPERVAMIGHLTLQNEKQDFRLVLDNMTGWQSTGNAPPTTMTETMYGIVADEAYVQWLSTVAPLTRADLTLSAAPPAAVGGQQCLAVKVSKAGRPETTLYFHKDNGLLMRAAFRGRGELGLSDKELVFTDHKEVAGVKLPMKVQELQQGVKKSEWTVKEYRFVDKFDANTFKKP